MRQDPTAAGIRPNPISLFDINFTLIILTVLRFLPDLTK